jgi:hypothetical protein
MHSPGRAGGSRRSRKLRELSSMLVNIVDYTFPADNADDVPDTFANQAALGAHCATGHFIKLGVNGIRPLAE